MADDKTREAYEKKAAEERKRLCSCGAHRANGACPQGRQ